jgi:hypothetical protein
MEVALFPRYILCGLNLLAKRPTVFNKDEAVADSTKGDGKLGRVYIFVRLNKSVLYYFRCLKSSNEKVNERRRKPSEAKAACPASRSNKTLGVTLRHPRVPHEGDSSFFHSQE